MDMSKTVTRLPRGNGNGASLKVPYFDRLNYFYGQMLSAKDFSTEQQYVREKLKLLNRCVHGWGVVCGLEVEAEPHDEACEVEDEGEFESLRTQAEHIDAEIEKLEADKKPDEERLEHLRQEREMIARRLDTLGRPGAPGGGKRPLNLRLSSGVAIDCEGNEIVVRSPVVGIDLRRELRWDDQRLLDSGDLESLFVSLCYCELPIEPTRPVMPDECGAPARCTHGKVRDAFRVTVSKDPPRQDERCTGCCEACGDPCVLLARVSGFTGSRLQVDNRVRRPLSLYQPTTITSINWTHGAEYTEADAEELLGISEPSGGLTVHFSHPVRAETLRRGVVDVWVLVGGARQGNVQFLPGAFVDTPNTGPTDRFRYRIAENAAVTQNDRLLITIRTNFILDECCQPVDGTNFGAWVAEDQIAPPDHVPVACRSLRLHPGPWATGDGRPGGNFESWFFIKSRDTEASQ